MLAVLALLAAEPATLAIVPPIVVAPKTMRVATSSLDLQKSIESAVERHVGLRVLRPEEIFVVDEPDLSRRLFDCGSDAECLSSRLARLGARYGLVTAVSYHSKPPFLNVMLVDTEKRTVAAAAPGPVEGATEITTELAARTHSILNEARLPLAAFLQVDTVPRESSIEMTGAGGFRRLAPGSPERIEPGSWVLQVSHPECTSETRNLSIDPGEHRNLSIELEQPSSILPWVILGGAAIGVGIGILVWAIASDPGCICLGPEDLPCSC